MGVKAMTFGVYARLAWRLLLKPRRAFRALPVHRTNRVPEQVLIQSSLIAGLLVSTILFVGATFVVVPRYHRIPIQSALLVFVVTTLLVNLLTWIEMMGVTAFSRRRGWRVPFPLAMRVCCLASVGWLPGAVLAGAGIWMIQAYGVGRPWFDSLFGLVRVGWLCYAGLFVLAFLWFETLVWIGVRQVRFANAWAEIQR